MEIAPAVGTMQFHPGSIWHAMLHPSPSNSGKPSSHVSPASTLPFPQKAVLAALTQMLFDPADQEQVQPCSTLHSLLQPSSLTVPPSSHSSASIGSKMLFPQLANAIGLEDEEDLKQFLPLGQLQPPSILHNPLHPSPLCTLPSSHCSPSCASNTEFPQVGVMTRGRHTV